MSTFHKQPQNHNCFQAVVYDLSRDDPIIQSQGPVLGGGHAQDGYCGAIFGAFHVLSEEKRKIAEEMFMSEAGGVKCSEIKGKKLSCQEYCDLAIRIVKKLQAEQK